MNRKLLYKLFAGYLMFALATFLLAQLYGVLKMRDEVLQYESNHLYEHSLTLASEYGYRFYNGTITKESLEASLNTYASYLDADVWVVSSDGKVDCVINNSGSPTPRQIKDMKMTDIFGGSNYSVGTFHSFFPEDYLSVYVPITVKYNVKGYLILHEKASDIYAFSKQMTHITNRTILYTIALSCITFVLIYLFVIRPVRRLCNIAEEYRNGNFKPQANIKGHDELAYIGDTMSFMATKLDIHEDEQRKFISNVSHDFRSPLTSIRGYIQAILDGTIPPELYNKYLNIISNETDRLTQLTNSLLDLNRIGARDAQLELSDFDMNDVLTNCAQSCEVQCTQKGIDLSLILCGDCMLVTADKVKIQQIVYNLLDNAMKFSQGGSTITIETNCKADKLIVSVKDQGIGIPKESLDNIWNRFYKSDLSRGKDKKGTGLGLSIVKEIIQAHDEKIWVESAVGVGTKFSFTLRLADSEL